MDTKLTLKLNKKTINRAKKYAREKNQSLSSMVENYFEMLTNADNADEIEISANVLELSGIVRLPRSWNSKESYGEHLMEKYS